MNDRISKLLFGMASVFAISSGVAGQAQNSSPCCTPKPAPCCPPKFEQGMPLCCDTYPRAINAPARIDVQGCWDLDIYASFIYWHVSQESMSIAVRDELAVFPASGGGFVEQTIPKTIAYQHFDYKPGFKVGFGFNFGDDDWVCFAEYTRLHQKMSNSSTLTSPSFWRFSDWFNLRDAQASLGDNPYRPTALSSSWKMNFDRVDLSFTRPFYQGKAITLSPYGGLRGLWITQAQFVALNPNTTSEASATIRSHCWSVGPNGGIISNWLVGMGFRFEGMAGASLLYTRYTTIALKQFLSAAAQNDQINLTNKAVNHDINVLRPVMEMGVGIGWGSYLSCQDWYLDLSVRYDFLQLWNQNVMRIYAIGMNGVSTPTDNLQMHGITATARFDF